MAQPSVANQTKLVPLPQLAVGSEVIEASLISSELAEELAQVRAETSADSLRAVIERRAIQWITDKVTESLLYQRATMRLGPNVEKPLDDYVDGEIRKLISTEHQGIQRRYEKALAAKGMTFEQARAKLRRESIIASYLDTEIRPKIAEPTRAQLLAAFEVDSAKWHRPARRKMSLIDVRVIDRLDEDVTAPSREQSAEALAKARSLVETALAEIRSGVSFAEVAMRRSDGLHAPDGGSWGWVTPDSVRERFREPLTTLQSLDEDEVSEIVEADDGFFLVRCDAIDPGFVASFQSVQPMLKEEIFAARHNQLVTDMLRELRESARISAPEIEQFHMAVVESALAGTQDEN